MTTRSELIETVFNKLNKNNMQVLDRFYDNEIVFEDPLGKIQGLQNMHSYYGNMYENVTNIYFDFTDEVIAGDTHVVVWTMHLWAKGLNKGKEVILDGNSLIRFGPGGKVIYHRDYFDMGAFIYEYIPVLGWAVGKVKKRLAHNPD